MKKKLIRLLAVLALALGLAASGGALTEVSAQADSYPVINVVPNTTASIGRDCATDLQSNNTYLVSCVYGYYANQRTATTSKTSIITRLRFYCTKNDAARTEIRCLNGGFDFGWNAASNGKNYSQQLGASCANGVCVAPPDHNDSGTLAWAPTFGNAPGGDARDILVYVIGDAVSFGESGSHLSTNWVHVHDSF